MTDLLEVNISIYDSRLSLKSYYKDKKLETSVKRDFLVATSSPIYFRLEPKEIFSFINWLSSDLAKNTSSSYKNTYFDFILIDWFNNDQDQAPCFHLKIIDNSNRLEQAIVLKNNNYQLLIYFLKESLSHNFSEINEEYFLLLETF